MQGLQGPQGIQGPVGPAGPQGEPGPAGAGTGDMLKSENLAGLENLAIARENLGVYSKSEVDLELNSRADANAVLKAYNDLNLILNTKVDKEEGKGLSSNDFTNEEKQKLASLENFSKDYNELTNKPNLFSGNYEDLNNKPNLDIFVREDEGKVLSDNNFSNLYKDKIDTLVRAGSAQESRFLDIEYRLNTITGKNATIKEEINTINSSLSQIFGKISNMETITMVVNDFIQNPVSSSSLPNTLVRKDYVDNLVKPLLPLDLETFDIKAMLVDKTERKKFNIRLKEITKEEVKALYKRVKALSGWQKNTANNDTTSNNNSLTTNNRVGIIFHSAGYRSNNSDGVRFEFGLADEENFTRIITNGAKQPGSVTEYNVNFVTLNGAIMSDYGDGYLASEGFYLS